MDSPALLGTEMHVDGFRFDLAATLARELHEVRSTVGAFFDIIQQDPIISQVKLIAEPWDLGEGGYQVGNFPPNWSEWNGKYRDCVRDYWRGQDEPLSEFAYRLTGSPDLYEDNWRASRSPASTSSRAHDGFTLHDLVSYNDKHNEANGEDNRDGRRQPFLELRRRRARRRSRNTRPSRPAEAQFSGYAVVVARGADAARGR